MTITVEKHRDLRGRNKGYKATLSGVASYLLQGEGSLASVAREDLLAQAASGISRMVQGPWVVFSPYPDHPLMAFVVAGFHGYMSVIIDPRESTHPPHAVASGLTDHGACIHGSQETDPRKILREKRIHMAQLLMDVTADRGMSLFDSDYLGADADRDIHARYLSWQDGYKRLADRGIGDEQIRRILAGYESEPAA